MIHNMLRSFLLVFVCIYVACCVLRHTHTLSGDYYITCIGTPRNITVHLYRAHSHKKWYLDYNLNYTNTSNPKICVSKEIVTYHTKHFKSQMEALNTSDTLKESRIVKIFPSVLCDLLNTLACVFGILLFFLFMLVLSNTTRHRYSEQRPLLPLKRKTCISH